MIQDNSVITDDIIAEEMVEGPKTDFYLKLNSEADLSTALAAFYKQDYTTVVDEETGEETQTPEDEPYLVLNTHDYAIDLVDTIYEPTGNMLTDDEGIEYPEMTPIDGFHVNIRLVGDAVRETVEALDAQYGVTPNSPSRVWL
jgi:hypothetical protein